MSHDYRALRDLTDEELVVLHDSAAEHAFVGVDYYLQELHRREVRRFASQTRSMMAFVDAGFLRPLGATVHKVHRSEVVIDGPSLLSWIVSNHAERFVRANIYDAIHREDDTKNVQARHDLIIQQDRLRATPGINLRIGILAGRPLRQKGVDTKIVLDMLESAQQGSCDVALLFAGDADFADAIEAVQRVGGRVALVVVGDGQGASKELLYRADSHSLMSEETLAGIVRPDGSSANE